MSVRWPALLVVVGTMGGMQTVMADVVEMKNGDRITGKVVSKTTDALKVDTVYGELNLKWDEVARLSTDRPAQIMLDDKTLLEGTLTAVDAGTLKIESALIRESAAIDLSRVTYINPPPELVGQRLKLSARMNMGAARQTGNTETETLHLDGEAVARSAVNRYTVGGIHNRSKDSGTETASNSTGYMKYDHFFGEKWFVYMNGILTKDKFKDLNLRTALGPGVGYQMFESKRTNLALEGGINYVNEDFIVAEDNDYAAARWALNFDHYLIAERLQFFHFHELFLGLQDRDDMLLRTQTGLRVPLFSGLTGTLQFNYDWDRSPAVGAQKSDKGYLFSLGYAM